MSQHGISHYPKALEITETPTKPMTAEKAQAPRKSPFAKLAKLFFCVLAGLGLAGGALFILQDHYIFFRGQYRAEMLSQIPKRVVRLAFETSQGHQVAYYLPARQEPGADRGRVWMVFGGQGSCALCYLSFAANFPDEQAAFLLVDNPGYGECEGWASPKAVLESSEKAFSALAGYLEEQPRHLEQRTFLLGESMGTGSALQFAVKHSFGRVVLLSPYTSVREVACQRVGPVCFLLRGQFDNRAFLEELNRGTPKPEVIIVSGTDDQTVPGWMGGALAKEFPQLVYHIEVRGGTHDRDSLFHLAGEKIFAAMRE